ARATLGTLLGSSGALAVSTSSSLLHVPYSLDDESGADAALRSWLAFGAGYLAEARGVLEAGLADGSLLGAATTNALELGVDIAGLDAVVIAGFPGTE
uniref:hypothetical protein n=1 Tax=Nocardia wallacei TaxID=480035 RepID=UPI002458B276